MEITHLLYVDDAIILCDAYAEQMKVLRIILTIFEEVSGLHDMLTGGRVLCFRLMALNSSNNAWVALEDKRDL